VVPGAHLNQNYRKKWGPRIPQAFGKLWVAMLNCAQSHLAVVWKPHESPTDAATLCCVIQFLEEKAAKNGVMQQSLC
jgi:hypothetical protein